MVPWKVIKSLQDIASCPVCYERLRGSVSCCTNGHAICQMCKSKLTDKPKCPMCSSKFSEDKHTTLSQILEAIPFSCRFKGCLEMTMEIDVHEKWCGFRPTDCIRCNWSGPANKLYNHVEKKHTINYDSSNYQHMKMTHAFVFNNAKVFNKQFFWEIRSYDANEKKYSVRLIWVPNGEVNDDIFKFNVEFKYRGTEYTASTKIKFNPDKDPEDENCLVFHSDMLKRFIDRDHIQYMCFISNANEEKSFKSNCQQQENNDKFG